MIEHLRAMAKTVGRDPRIARGNAHEAFDVLWKSGQMSRTEAYLRLAEHMGLHPKECHIRKFNAEQCDTVISWATDARK